MGGTLKLSVKFLTIFKLGPLSRIPHSTYRTWRRYHWYLPLLCIIALLFIYLFCRWIVHSATKWIGGHGTTIAGVIIDAGELVLAPLVKLVIDHHDLQVNLTGQSPANFLDSQNQPRAIMVSSSARLSVPLRSLLKSGLNSSVILVRA